MIPYICYSSTGPCIISEKRTYCVYFLRSLISNKTYVGYTTNIYNRIRQHNGFLAGPKTKRTEVGRPWEIVCIISGFPTARSALQFEYGWHDTRAGQKRIPGKEYRKGKYRNRYRKCPHITDCKEGLVYMLNKKWTETAPEPRSFPLTVIWNTSQPQLTYCWSNMQTDYHCWSIFQGMVNYNRLVEQTTGAKMYD